MWLLMDQPDPDTKTLLLMLIGPIFIENGQITAQRLCVLVRKVRTPPYKPVTLTTLSQWSAINISLYAEMDRVCVSYQVFM